MRQAPLEHIMHCIKMMFALTEFPISLLPIAQSALALLLCQERYRAHRTFGRKICVSANVFGECGGVADVHPNGTGRRGPCAGVDRFSRAICWPERGPVGSDCPRLRISGPKGWVRDSFGVAGVTNICAEQPIRG